MGTVRQTVLSPSACRARAKECLALARLMDEEHRRYLLQMALIWRGLAHDRGLTQQRQIDGILKAAFSKIEQEPVPEVFYSLLGRLAAADPHDDSQH